MTRVRMEVSSSQYWICADDVTLDDSEAVEIAKGLASWQPGQVIVTCAAEYSVPIDVERLGGPPEVDDRADWQDVVEFSLHTADGMLRLVPLFDEPRRPNLATAGPGDYRLRLSARSRDAAPGRVVKETQRLQVWAAPRADPIQLRSTSEFAKIWGVVPLPWIDPDWDALALTPGARLLVDWWTITPPPGPVETTTVSVNGLLQGSPANVFNSLVGGLNPGSLGRGTHWSDPLNRGYTTVSSYEKDSRHARFGNLWIQTEQTESTKFSHATYIWGLEERPTTRTDNAAAANSQTHPARNHPIPPGSTTVEFAFTKHPEGRRVTITHRQVPTYLAGDIEALWRIVLDGHNANQHPSWPWEKSPPVPVES